MCLFIYEHYTDEQWLTSNKCRSFENNPENVSLCFMQHNLYFVSTKSDTRMISEG